MKRDTCCIVASFVFASKQICKVFSGVSYMLDVIFTINKVNNINQEQILPFYVDP